MLPTITDGSVNSQGAPYPQIGLGTPSLGSLKRLSLPILVILEAVHRTIRILLPVLSPATT